MGLLRSRRESDGPDPDLDKKILIFFLGAGFGLAGMFTDNVWLIATGIAILMIGFLLRFIRRLL